MHLNNLTTGQLERLQLLGCPVVIHDGKPKASIIGLAVASVNAITNEIRVRSLRHFWQRQRHFDKSLGYGYGETAFWETYMATRYKAREILPSRGFNRA